MLILSRNIGQTIKIGDDIEIKILGIQGDEIRHGIQAPKSVDIYRKEVLIRIAKQDSSRLSAKQLVLINGPKAPL